MKAARVLLIVSVIGILVLSCKKNDEPFYQVNAFESALHDNVSDYRGSQGLDALVWFPDIFVEAREHSTAWKNSGDAFTGINERLGTIQDHWEPTTLEAILTSFEGAADTTHARMVVESWIADSANNAILISDVVQSGAGIAEDGNGKVFVTHFLMKIPTK